MAKTVDFFPNCKKYKTPTGAAAVGEPIKFTLKFTRPQNPSEVFLVLTKDFESPVSYAMTQTADADGEYTYEIAVKITSSGLYFYHFDIQNEEQSFRVGCGDNLRALLGKGHEWQLTVTNDSYAPSALDGGVMYEIMPDRFFIGGERRKTKPYAIYRDDWGGAPENKTDKDGRINIDFFGGNLKGIAKKLTYLKNLGVTCIYLTPIFEAHSNHKYDVGNYMRVDGDFGTADDLKDLIKKANKRGIKIILDGVFSHTGDDSVYFNKYGNYDGTGAYNSTDSAYYPWYKFGDGGYETNNGLDIMPAVNDRNAFYDEFVTGQEGVIRTWTRLGLGGWRLDVCEKLSDEFIKHCVTAAKRENPDAVVFGDVFADATNMIVDGKRRNFVSDGKLDSVTNHPFREDIINFVKTGDGKRLDTTVGFVINNYPKHAVDCLVNVLGNHDTARIKTALGGADAVRLVKMAAALQYTLPGVPCVFYGDEIGMEGGDDPLNRRCYDWENGDRELRGWYKKLGAVRANEREVFAHGKYCAKDVEDGIMCFARKIDGEEVIVVANNSGKTYTPTIEGEYTDLITYKPFGGTVADKSVAIIKLTKTTHFPVKPIKKKKA